MPVEGAERGEAAPGKALVSVEKGVIPRDAHRKHGCLIEELGVHVVSAKRCLGSVKGGIEKVDAENARAWTASLDPRHGFGNCASASARLKYLTEPNGRGSPCPVRSTWRSVADEILVLPDLLDLGEQRLNRPTRSRSYPDRGPRPRRCRPVSSGNRTVVVFFRHAIMIASHHAQWWHGTRNGWRLACAPRARYRRKTGAIQRRTSGASHLPSELGFRG